MCDGNDRIYIYFFFIIQTYVTTFTGHEKAIDWWANNIYLRQNRRVLIHYVWKHIARRSFQKQIWTDTTARFSLFRVLSNLRIY